MAQQPFTPAGVQQKQTELYQLSDDLLAEQADQIRSDFRTWLNNNFILDTDQQSYLSGIDDRFIQISSQETAFAVQNRLSITITTGGTGSGKLIQTGNERPVVAYSNVNGFTASGGLSFEIIYS